MPSKRMNLYFGALILLASILFLPTQLAHAAPIVNFPITVTQPDGTKVQLLASGDEYYNWLEDAQGYTVMQNPDTGYYVYADLVNGKLVATKLVAGQADPQANGLSPKLNISADQKLQIRKAFLDQTMQAAGAPVNAPSSGTITNLVVYIRFSDEAEAWSPTANYESIFNDTSSGANSVQNYYHEVSYGKLTVASTLLPTPGAAIVSYQDTHPRAYYKPYAADNLIGYQPAPNDANRTLREHTLLRDAVAYINGLGQFPPGSVIDADNNGIVDSLTFIISGEPTAWSTLLWPHQWNLYTYAVTINGKAVDDYSFHLDAMLNTGVLAHEMFHTIGAPDLYHYVSSGTPVGSWDVMEMDQNPPESMGCYMKYKYGKWIDSIPLISASGTYTLNPLTSPTDNCYRINSPYSTSEFFILEYRQQSGTFESSLPGSGLLVYRINTLAGDGNAYGPPDEVYIYRPGGTTTTDGNVFAANFSSDVGRTAINDGSNPASFLSNGKVGGLNISAVSAAGATISFNFSQTIVIPAPVKPVGVISNTRPTYAWAKVSRATQYQYQLFRGATLVYTQIVPASACGTTANCVRTPANVLPYAATYTWRVRAMVAGVWQAFSSPTAFKLTNVPTPISPADTIGSTTPTYTFSKIFGATRYQFVLYRGAVMVYSRIVAASICGATTNCVRTPVTVLPLGDYTWKVRAMVGGAWRGFSPLKAFSLITASGFDPHFTLFGAGWTPFGSAWSTATGW